MTLHPLVATATQTCFACPEQWEGTLIDGSHFYFRYRHGVASLGVGPDEGSAVDDPNEVSMRYGDSMQGILDGAESRRAAFAELMLRRFLLPTPTTSEQEAADRLVDEILGGADRG